MFTTSNENRGYFLFAESGEPNFDSTGSHCSMKNELVSDCYDIDYQIHWKTNIKNLPIDWDFQLYTFDLFIVYTKQYRLS